MSTKFVCFINAHTRKPILVNPDHVRTATEADSHKTVRLVIGEAAEEVEGDLKSIWETLAGGKGDPLGRPEVDSLEGDGWAAPGLSTDARAALTRAVSHHGLAHSKERSAQCQPSLCCSGRLAPTSPSPY